MATRSGCISDKAMATSSTNPTHQLRFVPNIPSHTSTTCVEKLPCPRDGWRQLVKYNISQSETAEAHPSEELESRHPNLLLGLRVHQDAKPPRFHLLILRTRSILLAPFPSGPHLQNPIDFSSFSKYLPVMNPQASPSLFLIQAHSSCFRKQPGPPQHAPLPPWNLSGCATKRILQLLGKRSNP